MSTSDAKGDLSELIAESFGANATYVEGLLNRYRSDPSQVDESWRVYFSELLGQENRAVVSLGSGGNGHLGEAQAAGSQATVPVAQPPSQQAPPAPEAKLQPAPAVSAAQPRQDVRTPAESGARHTEFAPIRGASLKIVENMEASLTVPTATSNRQIPVKVLEENRVIVNRRLAEMDRGKTSFTHFIAFAILRALEQFPQLNDSFGMDGGKPSRLHRPDINLGIAIDMARKDGTRSLLVPNVKRAGTLSFSQFVAAYDDVVKRAREGKLQVADFQDTTVSLTNPGTIGTVTSSPRLMMGQSLIIATGAIGYPAEYQAMSAAALSQLGISKVINISSTYDHRVIQGAESGAFLALLHQLLLGEHNFYDQIFSDLKIPFRPMHWSVDYNPALLGGDHQRAQTVKQVRVRELINAYRIRGHLIGDLDPLHAMPLHYHPELDIETYGLTVWDLDREFVTGGLGGVESATLREILDILRRSYCGRIGVEYRHIQSLEQKRWIQERMEGAPEPAPVEVKNQLLWKLISAEQFERFLHTKYLGHKRFSLEGGEVVIPLLDQLIEGAAMRGVQDITLGMAHRGRLNVLANVIGKFCERIFTSFEGSVHPNFPADEGDVKYHQGARGERETADGQKVKLTVSPNPSHLEFVDPVVEGMVRAKQDAIVLDSNVSREEAWKRTLAVLLHGDAAFAGQGIVMETLNLADLKGYRTGGTIHIIINNQIGFTTSPEQGRSTIYSTDVAKMTQLPIFHVNADDPEAVYRVLQYALDFRKEFHKDVVIDVIGFRRLGHNEADEPSYTQPLMYANVRAHEGVRAKYARQLVREGVVTDAGVQELIAERIRRYEKALAGAKEVVQHKHRTRELPPPIIEEDGSAVFETGISPELIREIAHQIALVPAGFNVNPKMVSQLARRAKMGDGELPLDWAFAEAIAMGSLATEGVRVRLSGQDSGRGTFSQRHAVLFDTLTGQSWSPLEELHSGKDIKGRVEVYDSSLSEQGVLGFEYGYSVIAQAALVMWEAQFGDFANGAQVIIDQFISPSYDKWQQASRLVLLLPHGYEGQGPEHSSARLERFLQLCAENNLQVCYPTTPAQYFHLLRRQLKQKAARPLIVMTPKSLLRLPAASSQVHDLTHGGFEPLIADAMERDAVRVERVVICSGKVFYDLNEARLQSGEERVAILRLEQFYPFPGEALKRVISSYPSLGEVVWVQEEPQNMGGWDFVAPRLSTLFPDLKPPRYIGRAPSASPATGSYSIHQLEQAHMVQQALAMP